MADFSISRISDGCNILQAVPLELSANQISGGAVLVCNSRGHMPGGCGLPDQWSFGMGVGTKKSMVAKYMWWRTDKTMKTLNVGMFSKSKVTFLSNWHAPCSENNWGVHMWQKSSQCCRHKSVSRCIIVWLGRCFTSDSERGVAFGGVRITSPAKQCKAQVIHTGHQSQTPSQSQKKIQSTCTG